jgi:urea transport system permease protein
VGGRGTLAGAILGAFLVNGAKSWLTVSFPNAWLFLLGALFVLVTLLMPGGIVRIFASPVDTRRVVAFIRMLVARRRVTPAMAVGKEQQP